MATTTNYYGLSKPSYNEVADIEVINANMDKIDTQMKNNSDGVNFAKGISSDAYDNSRPYAVGDYCIYDNKLYRCITAIESAEEFNVEKWEQTTVGNEINQLNSNLEEFDSKFSSLGTISSNYWLAPNKLLIEWGKITNVSFTRVNDNFAYYNVPLPFTYGNINYSINCTKSNYANAEVDIIVASGWLNGGSFQITLESQQGILTQAFLNDTLKNMVFSYITIGKKS